MNVAKSISAVFPLFAFASCDAVEQFPETSASSAPELSFIAPSKPTRKMIPKQNSNGNTVSGTSIPATSVFSFSPRETYALHGYIIPDGRNELHGFFWNAATDLNCIAFAERNGFGPYLGYVECKRGGAVILDGPFGVDSNSNADARGDGEISAQFALEGGGEILLRTEWSLAGFPNTAAVASRLGKPKTIQRSPSNVKPSSQQALFEDMEG